MIGTFSALIAAALHRQVCPECKKRALRCVATRSIWSPGSGGHIERMYRCAACGAELMRRGKGPFIPKALWTGGVRGELPEARVIEHRD
ncbi:MAG TPA: hypothetical protein VGG28_04135 [Kofleriaceae bacterium]|jgi:DNA-directed RNA polymerase subunit RPC12/RpoP